ncbi:carboxypeptidase regulatory-like domain-containing protein [Cupriavidus sp. WKF15]|uniref:carboxypeptidase regulatory-like domain-containing protein n=1 Tax=Cupriavidus sp. WKF15 TaxID=3032282 RepID=UPI0023E0A263|nr:carboxypeptidase regulatory-like domain-containing protein [Cupriavidus sp. WKF15]WER48920.1 carboxypeptidase regulatory-like domain-containing protein [Cupriavidus sp. WKF15]
MRAFIATCCLMLSVGTSAGFRVATATSLEGTLQPRQLNGISYVSGGIGIDEAAAMRGAAKQFNVRMHFVDSADSSALSDVTVTLFNARREIVLLVLSEGPYLYMNLPRGTYRALIRYGGVIVSQSITVTGSGAGIDLLLRFPSRQPGGEALIAT